MLSKIQIMIRLLTRAHGYDLLKAGSLREVEIARSFTPGGGGPSEIVNPFKELPNIRNLKLETNVYDPLLARFGVNRKLTPEMVFEVLSWRTKASNRYMRIMHARLAKLLRKGHLNAYWVLALLLMRKSRVLRALALRKFELNWHKKYKLGSVKKWLNQLDAKIQNMQEELSIKRIYVDKVKPDGTKTFRPIGSPEYPERMYLYLWQCFIVIFVSGYISKHQHAYLPGRGCPTALKDVSRYLSKREYGYMWEFDLKGAFPSVFIPEAVRSMKDVGFPYEIADWIENSSLLTVEEVDLKLARDRGLGPSGMGRPLPEPKFVRQDNIRQGPLPRFAKIGREIELEMIRGGNRRGTMGARYGLPIEFRGFPQGSGVSPILFNFVFERAALRGHFQQLNPNCVVISYADDFLVFSKEPMPGIFEASDAMLQHGLEFSLEKSRPLKVGGLWAVPKFKFLGTTFNTVGDEVTLTGTPRSGKVLPFDKEEMVSLFAARDEQLNRLGRGLGGSINLTAENIMAAWGQGVEPFSRIPMEVMSGDRLLSSQELLDIREMVSPEAVESFKAWESNGFVGDAGSSAFKPAKLEVNVAELPHTEAEVPNLEPLDYEIGGNLDFLNTRLKGLIINRLYGGEWVPELPPTDRSLKPSSGSWLDLKRNTALFFTEGYIMPHKSRLNITQEQMENLRFFEGDLSIYNSTSLAMVDMLRYLKSRKVLKIKARKILRSL